MRERIVPKQGVTNRTGGVTVSWRKVSARAGRVLVVMMGKDLLATIGLAQGMRCVVERDRMLGRLYLRPCAEDTAEAWKPTWKDGCAAINAPLDDVKVAENKPAQMVMHEWDASAGELCVRLPPWACPPVKVLVPGKAA